MAFSSKRIFFFCESISMAALSYARHNRPGTLNAKRYDMLSTLRKENPSTLPDLTRQLHALRIESVRFNEAAINYLKEPFQRKMVINALTERTKTTCFVIDILNSVFGSFRLKCYYENEPQHYTPGTQTKTILYIVKEARPAILIENKSDLCLFLEAHSKMKEGPSVSSDIAEECIALAYALQFHRAGFDPQRYPLFEVLGAHLFSSPENSLAFWAKSIEKEKESSFVDPLAAFMVNKESPIKFNASFINGLIDKYLGAVSDDILEDELPAVSNNVYNAVRELKRQK